MRLLRNISRPGVEPPCHKVAIGYLELGLHNGQLFKSANHSIPTDIGTFVFPGGCDTNSIGLISILIVGRSALDIVVCCV